MGRCGCNVRLEAELLCGQRKELFHERMQRGARTRASL
jgi:hypothetical protein